MTKKHFIALADAIRKYNSFTPEQLAVLAEFAAKQNPTGKVRNYKLVPDSQGRNWGIYY